MADQTLTVTQAVKTGVLNVNGHANMKASNAAAADYFYFANDGKVVLVVVCTAASSKALTFTPVLNKYGRTETLAVTPTISATSVIGPFPPHLFNQADGRVKFQPATSGSATDLLLALRVG